MNKKIGIAILGLGTVGYGTFKVLESQKEEAIYKIGADLEIRHILVRNVEKAAQKTGRPELITDNFDEILTDDEVQIVVELMGGIEPARTYIEKSLKAGKHVVTANKDLIASNNGQLMDLAKANSCDLMFEAAVAGAIPVILPLKQSLSANHITDIMGIVNGTTNFILTKMAKEGMEFDEALALATELGYAEADPTADVEGLDAGRKVAIMASIAFNSRVSFDDVTTEGITKISAGDIRYAKDMGCTIKLIGRANSDGNTISAYVAPMLIPLSHPLASVDDSYNAVFVSGDAVDSAMFQGRGAGELPTASAVCGDIFEVARNIVFGCNGRIGCTCYKKLPITVSDEVKNKFFLRVLVEDRIGVLAEIADVFARHKVSIDQIMQKQKKGDTTEIVVITESVRQGAFNKAVEIIEGKYGILGIQSKIRVL